MNKRLTLLALLTSAVLLGGPAYAAGAENTGCGPVRTAADDFRCPPLVQSLTVAPVTRDDQPGAITSNGEGFDSRARESNTSHYN